MSMKRMIFLLYLVAMLLPSQEVEAHRFAPSLFKLTEVTPNVFAVVWKTPSEATSSIPLRPTWPEGCRASQQSEPVAEGTGVVSTWNLNCVDIGPQGLVGQTLGVTGLAENRASAMVSLVLLDERVYQGVVNAGQPQFQIPEQPSSQRVMVEYAWLGGEHIWGGIDHLMFVFGLLLLVGAGTRLLLTITAFTVGHSVTLALVTLGFLTYPVSLVEFAIALSIFVLALSLTEDGSESKPSLFQRHPWWLAGGFGLLHGMGFAGALAEVGLPQNNVPLALLFFNLGIELGQISFVLLVLGFGWFGLRVWRGQHSSERPQSGPEIWRLVPVYLLGGLSVMWCIERGLEVLSIT